MGGIAQRDAVRVDDLTDREREIREMLVEVLRRPDLSPEAILPDSALHLLGFDSLDQIQIALRIQQRYQVNLGGLDPGSDNRFQTLRTLAGFVEAEILSLVHDQR